MKKILLIGAIGLGVLLVVLAILPFVIPVDRFRPLVEEQISDALGRDVKLGKLSLSVWTGSLAAENLSIADDPKFSSAPFLKAQELKVGVEWMPLILDRAVRVTGLTIVKPEVLLLQDTAGRWNFSSIGGESPKKTASKGKEKAGAPDLAVQKLTLTGGRLTLGKKGVARKSVYDNVDVEASGVSYAASFPVKVSAGLPGGGSFQLEGRVGPVNQSDASLTPVDAKIVIRGFDLGASGVLDASSGFGGKMDLDAQVKSQNGEAQTRGTMKLNKLLLVAGGSPSAIPAEADFSTRSDLRRDTGVLNPSVIRIGKAEAHIGGTYDSHGEDTVVNMKFDAQDMPAKDLAAFLPALAVNLPKGAALESGLLSGNLEIKGPTDRLLTSGTVNLVNAKITGFDLGAKLAVVSALTGIKTGSDIIIEKMTSGIQMNPAGIRAENFNMIVTGLGTLTGAGTVDAKNNLNFKMLATLAGKPAAAPAAGAAAGTTPAAGGQPSGSGGLGGMLGGLLGQGGQPGQAKGGSERRIPFLIQGTASDPKFLPDVGAMGSELLKTALGGASKQPDRKKDATAQPDQQQNQSPLGGLGDLFKKKKKP
ncbi:MAG: AsmA family protein [Acidobacteriia bacterium]|nr:AsmA family protein [Terriglobia bacterium]